MAANVGSVQVTVLPDASQFRQKLDAELRNIADVKVNVDVDTSGAQTKIDELVRSRTINVGVDVDTAAALARMEELSRARTARVGVDLDTGDALIRLEELSRARTAQLRVDLDDAGAEARLAALARDRTANIRVNTIGGGGGEGGGLLGGGGGLLAAGIGAAPLAVPLGAASLTGLAGIGAAAGLGVGALGSLALALKDVSGANTALDAAQKATTSSGRAATVNAGAQASAAAGLASAQAGVANAIRSADNAAISSAAAVKTAQTGVTDAVRSAGVASVASAAAVKAAQAGVVDATRAANLAILNSTQAVQSAQVGVADAQRTAAASVASALGQQEGAERSLEAAQLSETTAQQNLTAARKTAQQQIQDLANSVADGALQQRGAALAVEQAQLNLNTTLANPKATQLQRDQSRLAYDQALQQVTDIGVRQQRLTEQKAASDKAGVEGSVAVTTAQRGLASATQGVTLAQSNLSKASAAVTEAQRAGAESVTKAQDSLGKAVAASAEAQRAGAASVAAAQGKVTVALAAQKEQARSSAETVAKAQERVTTALRAQGQQAASSAAAVEAAQRSLASAQRAVAQAAIATGGAARGVNTAALAAAAALAKLTPEGRKFTEFLRGSLLPAVQTLKATAQEGLLPGLQKGLTSLLTLAPVFNQILGSISTALGGLFAAAGEGLTGPFFTQFFKFIADTAGPALTVLGQIIGNLATGFLGLFQGFAPAIAQIGGGVLGLSQKFASFGTTLSSNSGFKSFMAYVLQSGPAVASFFGSLFRLVGNLIVGLAPLGLVMLNVITKVSDFIVGLGPNGLLLAIAGVAAALVPFTGGLSLVVAGVTAAVAAVLSLYNGNKTFHDFVVNNIFPVFKAIGGFITGTIVPAFKQFGGYLADTVLPILKKIGEDALVGLRKGLDFIGKAFKDNQGPLKELGAILLGVGKIIVEKVLPVLGPVFSAVLHAVGIIIGNLVTDVGLLVKGFNILIGVAANVLGALSHVPGFGWARTASDVLKNLRTTLETVGESTKSVGGSISFAGGQAEDAKTKTDRLSDANKGLKTAQDNLSSALQTGIDKFTVLNGGVITQQRSTDSLAASFDSLRQSLTNNGTALDSNTEKGRANRAAVLNVAQALNDKAQADFRATSSTRGNDAAVAQANDTLARNRQRLIDILVQSGVTRQAAEQLAGSILRTPTQVKTEYQDNISQARRNVSDFQSQIDALHGKTIRIGVDGYTTVSNPQGAGRSAIASAYADGGLARGPGTGTSDSILARLSDKEFVVKASETAKHLPLLHAINNGMIPGYAQGGPVIPYTGSTDFNPATSGIADYINSLGPKNLLSAAALASVSASSAPGVGDAVTRWAGVILQALALQNLPATFLAGVENVISHESGGNPNAINLTDSNAQAGYPSQGLMQCVTTETTILTRRGWLHHDEVRVGDETIGYNPATGRNEWTRITKVVHYEDAPVWRVGHRNWHADVTPNHRWWSDTEAVRSAELDTICNVCGFESTPRGVSTHRGRVHGLRNPQETVYRGEFVRTEDFASHHRIRLSAPATTDGIPALSLEDAAVLGWLLGDGHISPAENDTYDGTIYQSKPKMVTKIRALLARIEHGESARERGGNTMPAHTFRLRRAYVTDLLKRSEMLDTGVEGFVLRLSAEQRVAWLDAMIDAEGNRQQPKQAHWSEFVRIAQINGPIQDAIRLAVYLEGYRPTFSANSAEKNGYKPAGTVGMAGAHVSPSTFSEHEVLENQTVWCVKTDLETWTAGLHGQVFVTGNTIPQTFYANAGPYGSRGITDPLANIYAGIHYAMANYGAGFFAGGGRKDASGGYLGYDNGGYIPPGITQVYNGTGRPEMVHTPEQLSQRDNQVAQQAGARTVNIHQYYPIPEPAAVSQNRALQLAGNLGGL